MHDPFYIPVFLRREPQPYHDLPISQWPKDPQPSAKPQPLTLPKRNHLGPMAKDLAAHDIAAALKEGPQTMQGLRALRPVWDARKLRIALRRGLRMHLFERPQGTRTYRLFNQRKG